MTTRESIDILFSFFPSKFNQPSSRSRRWKFRRNQVQLRIPTINEAQPAIVHTQDMSDPKQMLAPTDPPDVSPTIRVPVIIETPAHGRWRRADLYPIGCMIWWGHSLRWRIGRRPGEFWGGSMGANGGVAPFLEM
jgi:hypothetical protein